MGEKKTAEMEKKEEKQPPLITADEFDELTFD